MSKLFFVFFVFITLKFISAEEKYAGDLTYTQYQAANIDTITPVDSFNSQPSGGDGMLGLSVLLGIPAPNGYRSPSSSSSGYSGYSNGYSAPYGNSQYTYGPINSIQTVQGTNAGSGYQNYANNYWGCVNKLRGQYYYSYNLGYYVCDIRANRYGK
uniref:Uncharacterized protein n=1 Tax=Panagrolaimus sp. ES5 TaxID=591445 RepID=A0AC34FNT4_9BILA